ncbi:uncharacterized protein [Rutidosis leptorrhynchoides]|uniref:uncharacterized protein n=1 Tax=Rutidosis leptorrhynchoides TaxID=125765 RepID=UPI003A99ECC6
MVLQKLTRKWRDSGDTLPTRDDDDSRPLDTQEQEELIRSFERSQAQQSRLWRSLFAAFLFCFAAFLTYSIYQQAFSPWELRYHAYFMEDISSWMVIAADWIAVLACTMSIMGLLHGSKKQWLWYSSYVGIMLAVFWLYFMLRLPKFRWDVIWLPFGSLSGAGLSLYVEHLLTQSSEEIRKLQSYMYAYKAS